tara:strand:+ start:15793 stop:16809 length:1017 start_codon:yes stop_codon:yes gene_type:complete
MQKQAVIAEILDVKKHPKADSLDLATVLGYQCVVPLNQYKKGDYVVYIEPDSVLPKDEPWAERYLKYAKTRVKAMKLRGEWSEGIIMDLSMILPLLPNDHGGIDTLFPGDDVTDILKVTHYVAPVPLSDGAIGGLPYSIPKTDEERWENLVNKEIPKWLGQIVDVTLKVDGQSWSAYYKRDKKEFGVLGRRMAFDPETANLYTNHIERYNIREKLTEYCEKHQVSLCIRGESYGENIQKMKHNPHSKLDAGLTIFSVYNMDNNKYEMKQDKYYFVNLCNELRLPHVDIIEKDVPLTKEMIDKYSKEIKKLNGKPFEGVVIKGSNFSFKVINKNYDSLK